METWTFSCSDIRYRKVMGDWASEMEEEERVAAGGAAPVPESRCEQGGEARARTATEGVDEGEALETSTVVSQLPEPVRDEAHDHAGHGVAATGVGGGSVLLGRDQLLGVEQLPVGSGAGLIDHGRHEVKEDSSRDVLARPGLADGEGGEEGEAVDGLTAEVPQHGPGILAAALIAIWRQWVDVAGSDIGTGAVGDTDAGAGGSGAGAGAGDNIDGAGGDTGTGAGAGDNIGGAGGDRDTGAGAGVRAGDNIGAGAGDIIIDVEEEMDDSDREGDEEE